nr:copper chaperone PCu(A)C [Gammaproteobacteria bacterium]
SNPHVSIAAPVAPVAGGYLRIMNHGDVDDRLVGASSEFADKVEIHESLIDNGVMKMRKLSKGVEIPAGEMADLSRGGLHIMFMKLNRPLEIGSLVEVELEFAQAGPQTVNFKITDAANADHQSAEHDKGHGASMKQEPMEHDHGDKKSE